MKEKLNLEILISTMNKKDLSFLDSMFPDLDTSQYSILIVNQTQWDEDLTSSNPKIRVVNSREFGLSKSRNLALDHAKGDILLIADDDIHYLPDFKETILNAYQAYPEASLISFQFLNEHKELGKLYPKKEGYLTSTKQFLTSFEMTFRLEAIKKHNIKFDERFGIGAIFLCAEEQVFRHHFLKTNLKVAFVSQPICIHAGLTSGFKLSTSVILEATTAYKYIQYNYSVYLWLLKYVFFLFRHNYISFFGQIKAYRTGLKAVSKFKNLTNEN